jgi:polar amino acid transport system substrate-binding protein
MEQPSESDVSSPPPASPPRGPAPRRVPIVALAGLLLLGSCRPTETEDTLTAVQHSGRLRYGSDKEGGGPYAFPDPKDPARETGFEVELMARLGRELGVRPVFAQGQWDTLLQNLATRRVDVVVNGYEWTPSRARDYLASRPYYVYQLQLMAKRGSPIGSWSDLTRPKPDGSRWRVGVLGGSAGEFFARDHAAGTVAVVSYTGATDAMLSVTNGQLDATLQDLPAARFYREQYPALDLVGPPEGHGYYVLYLRKGDEKLCGALNAALGRLIRSGEMRRIYERYDIWTDAQSELAGWTPDRLPTTGGQESARGWPLVAKYGEVLLTAAGMTVFLSVTAMPLAILIGLFTALGRLYGPKPLRWALTAYVEFLRGTPLMLQLFVLFYLARLPALVAGIGGLAINYSAYEAEIYRAGLQAIPAGQMEAALALGMSRGLALRRIIVPQAVRIVIPPVTNDFIALFKDTSVCSVITLVELSKQYQILANSTGGVLEFAVATSVLYLLMSLPLSWFSRWSERMLGNELAKGGAPA